MPPLCSEAPGSIGSDHGCDAFPRATLRTMSAEISVNVAKYSYATGVRPDNTIPWTHVVASNVYLVLKGENTGFQNGDVYLQVIQANTALVRLVQAH